MSNSKYYLVHVFGAVEPEVQNPTEPFATYPEVVAAARKFAKDDASFNLDESVIFYLVETDDNGLTAGSFTDDEIGLLECECGKIGCNGEHPPQQGDSCPKCREVLVQGPKTVFCPTCAWPFNG